MRILLLDQFSEPGGAQFCLRDLIVGFLSQGWEPILIAPGDGALMEWCRRHGISTCTLPLFRYSNGRKTPVDYLQYCIDAPRMALAVRQIALRSDVDLVYVNGPRVLPGALGVNRPVVFHAHNRVRGWREQLLMRSILRATNAAILAASDYVAAGHESARTIYGGVADLWKGARRFDRMPRRVGIIGRIAPEKGQLDFVRAARRLRENGTDAEFVVYGERLFADGAYEAQVRSKAGCAVKFLGWTNDIGGTLRSLDILAVPSGPDEAAGRVIIEAFSAGTPVVAYAAGGIPEVVEHGLTGLLTDKAEAQSLARSIDFLLSDRALSQRLSAEGRREWSRRFRIEQFQSTVCDLLEQFAQNTRGMHREGWAQAPADGERTASQ